MTGPEGARNFPQLSPKEFDMKDLPVRKCYWTNWQKADRGKMGNTHAS